MTDIVVIRRRKSPPVADPKAQKAASKSGKKGVYRALPTLPTLGPPVAPEETPPYAGTKTGTPPAVDYGAGSLPPFLESVRITGSLPLNEMFSELFDMYKSANPKIRNADIAALLGIRPQSCSQYKTGSDGRKPPWRVVLALMSLLNQELVISGGGWAFRKRRKKKKHKK